ncbi:hypothetical protein BDN72DRAFT_830423 [Pluteus cervinus]|uniref:Uncharacterized protein n=1 Tax=Pluteus cervinus TaxID=181527 RepID=A0ACD3BHE0_9AGAR|nr:hypothetical protein BDN72DRAFT_830423 [Pluteus cervinus]
MSMQKTKNILLTLFTALVLTGALVQASELHSPLQRDHANIKRLIKKRASAPADSGFSVLLPVVGGAAPSPSLPPSGSISGSASASSTSASSTSASSSSSTASASSSSVSSSSQSSSSSSSSSVASETTSEALNLTDTPATTSKSAAVVTHTENVEVPAPSAPAIQGNVLKDKNDLTLTLVIAIAASVGGIAILWTVFRKWKLGRSNKFDKRLEPADWQPTQRPSIDDIVPAHRRTNSGGSFHSTAANRMGPLPDHDFTAGATSVGGYADLARGGPQMQESRRAPGYGGNGGYRY